MSKRNLTNEKGFIYKITAPFGAVYIGQTINVYKRKYAYKRLGFKKQTKLWNSYQKYNWEPFQEFEVIEECICGEDKCNINDREIYWISYYDSFKNGLNCTEGGKGQLSKIWTNDERQKQREITLLNGTGFIKGNKINKGKILSDEHKDKIRESCKEYLLNNEHWNKGKILSDEVKKKISNSVSGEKNGFYGKTHTDEIKKKMCESHTGTKLSEETKKKMSESHLSRDKSNDKKHTVSVLQYDINNNFIQKFNSIKEASISIGISTASIILVCKGIRKFSKNFIFKYENK
jgi:group I intron endonuclease